MIWQNLVDAFVSAVRTVLGGLFDMFPAVPSWLNGDGFADVVDSLQGISRWVPIDLTFQVASAVVTAYITAGTVGLLRSVLSHLTGGGGSS